MKIKLYKNYGVLAHEKEPLYTYHAPVSEVYDRVTVDIPQVIGMNEYDEPIVSLEGMEYPLQDVLTTTMDGELALRWYDGQFYYDLILLTVEEVNRD